MVLFMVSNLFFPELLPELLPCPTGEDGPRDISLWATSYKKISSWKGHKKNPQREIKKLWGLLGCNFLDY